MKSGREMQHSLKSKNPRPIEAFEVTNARETQPRRRITAIPEELARWQNPDSIQRRTSSHANPSSAGLRL
jgi:hypothetical protein